jgi:hypothetical protein
MSTRKLQVAIKMGVIVALEWVGSGTWPALALMAARYFHRSPRCRT